MLMPEELQTLINETQITWLTLATSAKKPWSSHFSPLEVLMTAYTEKAHVLRKKSNTAEEKNKKSRDRKLLTESMREIREIP